MHGLTLLLCMTLAQTQAPSVEVITLSEKQFQGSLESFSGNSIVIKTESETVTIPVADALTIRSVAVSNPPAAEPSLLVRLVDGSRLSVQKVTSAGTTMTVTHPQLAELRLPVASVTSIRLAPPDPKVDAEWDQLLERSAKKDMVAVRKGDVLDHLDGVIGSLNDTTLQFQLDGDDIPVKREKVFGLIYSKRESTAKKAVAQLELTSGDRLAVKQVSWSGSAWKVRLVSGLDLEVTPDNLRSLDYGASKFTYLSDLEPRNVEYTSFIGNYPGMYVWEYRRDKDLEGKKISIGKKPYSKGLALHSKALLKYRLGGDYRRFQAVMGIGDEIERGNADVTIKVDNKVVYTGVAKTIEKGENGTVRRPEPQVLDIDVSGAVEMEILVGYGDEPGFNSDTGDRVYFGNARLVR